MRRAGAIGGVRWGAALLALVMASAACGEPGAVSDASDVDAARDGGRDESRDEGRDEGDEGNVYSLMVTPRTASVGAGETVQFVATSTDQSMRTFDLTSMVTWSSSNAAVATVDSQGRVLGMGTGAATISARWEGLISEATVTVTDALALVSVALDPPAVTLSSNSAERQRFAVRGTFSDGQTRDVTSMATFALDTPNATLGTGSDASVVTARMQGPAVLTARVGALTSAARITVTGERLRSIAVEPGTAIVLEGETRQFHAIDTLPDGTSVVLTEGVMWSSGTSATASVDPMTGIVTGVAASAMPVTITATVMPRGGTAVSGTATVLVTSDTRLWLSASLEPAGPLGRGESAQVHVQASFANGTSRDLTADPEVSFMSGSPETVTVSPTGRVVATGSGVTPIYVRYRGQLATLPVTVIDDGVARLELAPRGGASTTLAVGSARALALTAFFADGTTRELTNDPNVVFSSLDRSVARVSNAADAPGVVSALANGTAVITARYTAGGVSRTATLTVTVRGECVDTVSLGIADGSPSSIDGDTAATLTPYAVAPSGARRELTEDVEYESSDAFAAAVHNATTGNRARGVVRAEPPLVPGFVTITARYTGADRCVTRSSPPSGTTSILVFEAARRFLIVRCTRVDPATGAPRALDAGRLVRGQRAQCAAFARSYRDASEILLSLPIWRATGSGSITPSGLATAGSSAGTLSIEAQSGSVIGTLNLPVVDVGAPTLSIIVRPALPSVGSLLRINESVRTQLVGVASYTYPRGGASFTESYDVTEQSEWTSSRSTRVDVSNATDTRGRTTGGPEAGDAEVTVAFGGATGSVTLQNSLFALRSLRAAFASLDGPNELALRPGERADLFARAEYCPAGVASGDLTCAFWDASPLAVFAAANTAVAAIETAGLRPQVRAIAGDATLVRATVGGITAAATLTVRPACITSIALDAAPIRAVAAGIDGSESSSHPFRVTLSGGDGGPLVLSDPSAPIWRDVTVRRVGGPASWPAVITAEQYFLGRFPTAGVGAYRAEYTGAHCATDTLTSSSAQTVVVRAGALTGVSVVPRAPAAGAVTAGSVAPFRATGTYSVDGGGTLTADVTQHDRVEWSAADASIASSVAATPGSFLGLRVGLTAVSARLGATVGTNILRVF